MTFIDMAKRVNTEKLFEVMRCYKLVDVTENIIIIPWMVDKV